MNHNWWQLEGVQRKHGIVAVRACRIHLLQGENCHGEVLLNFYWELKVHSSLFIAYFLTNVWRAVRVLGLFCLFIFCPTAPREPLVLEGKTWWVLLDDLARNTVITSDACLSLSPTSTSKISQCRFHKVYWLSSFLTTLSLISNWANIVLPESYCFPSGLMPTINYPESFFLRSA